jgi:hypothetical protein
MDRTRRKVLTGAASIAAAAALPLPVAVPALPEPVDALEDWSKSEAMERLGLPSELGWWYDVEVLAFDRAFQPPGRRWR